MTAYTLAEPSLTADRVDELFSDVLDQDENQEVWTVGYGERFDAPPEDATFEVADNNDATGVSFPGAEAKHGFDLTSFGEGAEGVENFVRVLDAVGLDPYYDYYRVFRDLGRDGPTDYSDYFLYVWANEDVMVATTTNPLTGERGDPDKTHMSLAKGSASYIGIAGSAECVAETVEAIREFSAVIKGENEGGLFY